MGDAGQHGQGRCIACGVVFFPHNSDLEGWGVVAGGGTRGGVVAARDVGRCRCVGGGIVRGRREVNCDDVDRSRQGCGVGGGGEIGDAL